MTYKEHLIELYVNGNKVELEDQKSINMRFNNVLQDPTKVTSTQAEYSFEFELPATPRNNTIFDYANNLGKLNKFHQRYNAEVYADGTVIFSGTITINSYKNKKYKVNLVSVKVYSLDEIFGDETMDKIPWYVPFDGVDTINERNTMLDTEVVFPFVSYGVFQKNPYSKDNVASDYTSKYDLDQWNTWYVESFPPSVNVMETLRKAFEYKDYMVGGGAFQDKFLSDIYSSVNLADGQSPTYNLGNPKFGKVELEAFWNSDGVGYTQSLKYPYWRIGGTWSVDTSQVENSEWNFSSVQLYDILEKGSVTVNNFSYMYQPNEHIIVIPADGWYKIDLTVSATLNEDTSSSFTASQYCRESCWTYNVEEANVPIPINFRTTTPIEIQLVRNYDDNIELIRGKNIYNVKSGNPSETTWCNMPNHYNMVCPYPHEKIGWGWWLGGFFAGDYDNAPPTRTDNFESGNTFYNWDYSIGYINQDNTLMMYDQAVSKAFICGFTSLGNDNGGGCAAVMKNGYSWSKTVSDKNEAIYTQPGYDAASSPVGIYPTDEIFTTATTHNQNTYIDSPNQYFSQTYTSVAGNISCMVYLNKNDKLQLYAVHRDYSMGGYSLSYKTSAHVNLRVEAASPDSYANLIRKNYGYYSPTEFDVDLRLSNFFNKEVKISDWVQQISDAFNLEIIQNGKSVEINTKKKFANDILAAVDIDDRTNSDDAESQVIDYPKSMAVKYKIDMDEWGAERSAVEAAGGDESVLNTDDWKKLVDSGYTVIQLSDDAYATSTSDKNLQFSYTWYQNFNWYAVNNQFHKTSDTPVRLKIPCISKFTYMIDGYDYEESMKHDGYGQPQRFWFRPSGTGCYVWTRTYPPERVMLFEPKNLYTNYQDIYLNLSYKNTEQSLLTQYFNVNAYLASNYVEVDVYLSPDEYNRIKNGSLIHFDSDLYIPIEIDGYDPSGNNPTTIKMMKKVA